MESFETTFIGRGWQFPIQFSERAGTAVMISDEEDIENSLRVLFETKAGERIMQPDFGSGMENFLFDQLSRSTITYMQAVIGNAILFHEPRIVLNDVVIEIDDDDPARINIRVDYTISATNNRYNYVYPFYLMEATNLQK